MLSVHVICNVYFLAALVKLANDLLQQLHVPQRIRHWADINAQVFITLYEGLCGESPSGMASNTCH